MVVIRILLPKVEFITVDIIIPFEIAILLREMTISLLHASYYITVT